MKARLGAIAMVLVVLVTACSGSTDREADTSSAALPTQQPATQAPATQAPATQAPAPLQPGTQQPAPTVAPAEPAVGTTCRGDTARLTTGRTDIRPSGNRLAPGSIDLLNAPMATVDLPAPAIWIVQFMAADDPCEVHWYATLEGGQSVTVDANGTVVDAGPAIDPPESRAGGLLSAHHDLNQFENPLPDGRVATFDRWTAALVDPTDRYGHGVLGDRVEASAVEVIDMVSGERSRITIDAPSVIEGISPMLLNVDQADDTNDGIPEVLVTLSNGNDGAWLALYNLDGTLRAQSAPIGRGNRWRNQLGAGAIGPDGAYEIVDVRTPHLDGVVEFFRVNGDQLERVAATSGYTSHVIGSRNLDMGILIDADRDKLAEVVLPTRDRGSLAVIDRVGDDAAELGRIDLEGVLNTNIATQWLAGQVWLAVGTEDGRLLVFSDPEQ